MRYLPAAIFALLSALFVAGAIAQPEAAHAFLAFFFGVVAVIAAAFARA